MSGRADADFNDLVLTCTAPVTVSNFLVYGNVSIYTGCFANPCFKTGILIETPGALSIAKRYPGVLQAIEKINPDVLQKHGVKLPIPCPTRHLSRRWSSPCKVRR